MHSPPDAAAVAEPVLAQSLLSIETARRIRHRRAHAGFSHLSASAE